MFQAASVTRRWYFAASLCAVLLSACGGGGGDSSTPPSITAAPVSQSIRIGDVASFSVAATGDAPLSYQWQRDGTDIADAVASSYSTTITRIADSGSRWTVRVSNAQGSVTSPAATLTVTPVQSGTISLAPSAYPLQRTVDAQGRYLRIENGNVLLVAPDGTTVRTLLERAIWVAAGLTQGPGDATLDANGVLYFSETIDFGCNSGGCFYATAIWKQGLDGTLAKFAGDNSQASVFQEGTGSNARFGYVESLRFHANGDLYAVSGNDVVKVSPSGVARRVASGQRYDWDAAGNIYSGDYRVSGFAGNIFGHAVLRKITPAGEVSVLAGSETELGDRDGPGAQALFNNIRGLAVDRIGNVYVRTTFEATTPAPQSVSGSIRRIAPSGEVTTVVGQRGLAGPSLGPLPGAMCDGAGLAVDAEGVLYAGCYSGEVLSIRFSN